jgi:curved DNA-binding protein CbpA
MRRREDLDPYVVLGVRRQASPGEIARAYRRAARVTHPDSRGSGAGSERFRLVSDAYEVLRHPGRRAGYDRLHSSQRQEAAPAAGGSVRYAAPGSRQVVLGSRPPSAGGRPGITATDELRAGRASGDIEALFAVVSWLLLRSSR